MSSSAIPIGLSERWNAVRSRLARAAARAGRPTPRLIAVTKSVGGDMAAGLVRLGQLDLGENRVQSLEAKRDHLRAESLDARWHLIGHLQRNKARRAVSMCHSVHSVDSLELARALSRIGEESQTEILVYLEVDYVRDGSRTGLAEEAVPELVLSVAKLPRLGLVGLMTIAPVPEFDGDTRRAREVFARLRRFSQTLPAEHFVGGRPLLSMGMSSDFEIATEEGSDCVRIGSALFEGEERSA
ncbi:MAG TPA: YggS family pyridoxal phosphate-dependent enzyme [Planctomycetota bacterium]|nr:YggS family pyridoxal phosphate-dependent enzyme [Planctomycetota bacterium]